MVTKVDGFNVRGDRVDRIEEILTDEAVEFLVKLHRHFDERRQNLLNLRKERQKQLNEGQSLNFLCDTDEIRQGDWTVNPIPEDLQDRRVEITGPVDRKMVINALNSGAKTFMADFEDATAPTWENVVNGQINLKDAIRRVIDFTGDNGKQYQLSDDPAVLIVRPRGWHLNEAHIEVDGKPMSGSLFDFGLYFFHNASELLSRGSGPYFYLPKLENHLEAKLWNDVFFFAQGYLGISRGTVKATVLIETLTAAFEMDEILYELREHSAGLNCGRWDYIFSAIKNFQNHESVLLPDRVDVTMEVPFMRAYSLLTIQTCHKRNAPAIGGMAAQIPVKGNDAKNEAAFNKVQADKLREVKDGHDGTWVAHPAMVPLAKEVFDQHMETPNQIHVKREDVDVSREDLLEFPKGDITLDGLMTNITVGIQYIAAWLKGRGAAPLNHLMEDAATAEISRAQVWQWINHPEGKLRDGENITVQLVESLVPEDLRNEEPDATDIFLNLIKDESFVEFLTIPAYDYIFKGGVKHDG
ncbi:malate synthase [Alkalibacillus filiformis]|uniref:Malate synthase n=1 Tax=Alkalibacillus filiformis TaxID=200990 RepID=A0ABU0DSD6_9BACI|nr:malate synthase A [Alkalibacillus filiformis]MDQ0351362.1 malate synthase [Alkalibacillus filiformis]